MKEGDRPLEFNLAWLERWSGKFDTSNSFADKALEVMDKDADPEGWVEIMTVKAVCAYSLGNHNLADEILKEAYDILGPAAHSSAGIEVLSILAILARYSQTYDKAHDYLDQALRIAEDSNLIFQPARILQVKSRAEFAAGDFAAALSSAQECVIQSIERRNRLILPYAYEVHCAALVACGDYEGARSNAEKGIAAAVVTEDVRVTCQLHYEIGNSYLKEHKPDQAITAFNTGLAQAQAVDYHLWVRNFHLQLSRTHELNGDHQKALRHLKIYTDMQAEQFNREAQKRSRQLRGELEMQLAQRSATYERQLRDHSEKLNKELVHANAALRDLNEQMQHNSLHDALTGVGNRRMMNRFFRETVTSDTPADDVGALLIDLDGFKTINDQFGHDMGDEVIVAISARLKDLVLDGELLARMGGDEFLIASLQRTKPAQLARLAATVIEEINRPVKTEKNVMSVGASVGISVCPIAPDLERKLLTTADAAMYQAKRAGRNQSALHPVTPADPKIEPTLV